MTERDAPVTEDELHAYVDGALPADRIAAVEAELAADPQARARAAAWRTQADLIRDRFASVADEPLPERLRLETVTRRASGLKRKLAIAAVIAFLIGAAAGWIAHEYSGFGQNAQLARALADAAIEAHRLYVNEVRHPIEVRAGEEHLLPWLSRRVGSPVKAPDLAPEGLKLLGGRLLPSPRGPTALIMYEGSGGERVTLTCRRAGRDGATAFHWQSAGEIGALAWVEGGMAFVVAGPAERERLDRVARRVYDAYEQPAEQR
ncbi:MAG TPA: anti-sigma factor [Xanthobacteraceae bacterium]|nr:anti-sigma factor [Xanthobacteraceae bacterium]